MPANPLTDPNWANDTTDTVVRLVGNIRDKTTTPLVYAARGLVFGIIAVLLGVFAAVITLVMVTRGAHEVLNNWFSRDQSVYLSYLAVGTILSLIGLWLFRKRNANAS